MSLYKCFMCDGVFDSKEKPIRTVKDGPRDGELICPLCHAFEPGFEELKDKDIQLEGGNIIQNFFDGIKGSMSEDRRKQREVD